MAKVLSGIQGVPSRPVLPRQPKLVTVFKIIDDSNYKVLESNAAWTKVNSMVCRWWVNTSRVQGYISAM